MFSFDNTQQVNTYTANHKKELYSQSIKRELLKTKKKFKTGVGKLMLTCCFLIEHKRLNTNLNGREYVQSYLDNTN